MRQEEYLDIEQIAKVFKVTTRTINNWINNSKMPFFSIKAGKGTHRRFFESDCRKWFEGFSNKR